MMKINKKQRAALSEEGIKDFENRMVKHLEKFFPAYCDTLGDAAVRRLVRYGILRAETYGVVAERGVCIYIDAMFAFGRDFDRDPDVPWAAKILKSKAIKNPSTRVDRLFEASFDHMAEARGIRVDEAEI